MKSPLPVFIGIDVNCAKRAHLPICFISTGSKTVIHALPDDLASLIPRGVGNGEIREILPFRAKAREVTAAVARIVSSQNWTISRIAIDAPAAAPSSGARASEDQLGRLGLSSFRTPSLGAWRDIIRVCNDHLSREQPLSKLPFANKVWMLFGFELFSAFRDAFDAEVIEVYPFAIARALVADCPHKSTEEGYHLQLNAIAARTGWEASALHARLQAAVPGRRHDRLDAYMSAWVASLPVTERRAYGNSSNQVDAIWVPAE
jgi:hypothetical protein